MAGTNSTHVLVGRIGSDLELMEKAFAMSRKVEKHSLDQFTKSLGVFEWDVGASGFEAEGKKGRGRIKRREGNEMNASKGSGGGPTAIREGHRL